MYQPRCAQDKAVPRMSMTTARGVCRHIAKYHILHTAEMPGMCVGVLFMTLTDQTGCCASHLGLSEFGVVVSLAAV